MTPKKATEESTGGLVVPDIDGKPHKVTTIRLTDDEYTRVELFAKAMGGVSMTEFCGKAIRYYLKACSNDPKLKKEIQREIQRQQDALNSFASQIFGSDE